MKRLRLESILLIPRSQPPLHFMNNSLRYKIIMKLNLTLKLEHNNVKSNDNCAWNNITLLTCWQLAFSFVFESIYRSPNKEGRGNA